MLLIKMNSIHYKPDIDGLRAVAVLGVIIYHAGLPLSGGYVGVDVFFVISGYLITQIILRESANSKFTLVNFWKRRILRILPASTVVTLVTLIAGYFILDQSTFAQVGQSALAQTLMISNIFFWKSSGYFAESAELQPLLHTWSLAVEEQFYLFLPLALTLLLKKGRRALCFLVLLTILSFALSVHGTRNYPSATFFMLPTRAWELSAGGLLAILEARLRFGKMLGEFISMCGLAMILVPMFVYTKHTAFPGLGALPPVLGAVALIGANRNSTTIVGKWLSSRAFVAVGLASYSLYLWHWPVLAYFKHVFVSQSGTHTAIALGITLILSVLSWKYIEKPFRTMETLKMGNRAFYFGSALTAIIGGFGALVWLGKGFPKRFSPEDLAVHSDITWGGEAYESSSVDGVLLGRKTGKALPPDFYFWGDSHGMVLGELVDNVADNLGMTGVALLSPGVAPVTGLWKPFQSRDNRAKATALNQARLDTILSSGTKDVILVARWDGMVNGMLPTEIDELRGVFRTFNMVVDSVNESPSSEISKAALDRQLQNMLENLDSRGVRVWLIPQVPACERRQTARDFYITHRFPQFNKHHFKLSTPIHAYIKARADSMEVFTSIKSSNLVIVDPKDSFFSEGNMLQVYGDRSYYRDEDHLTRAGANRYMRDLIEDLLNGIKSGKRRSSAHDSK